MKQRFGQRLVRSVLALSVFSLLELRRLLPTLLRVRLPLLLLRLLSRTVLLLPRRLLSRRLFSRTVPFSRVLLLPLLRVLLLLRRGV